MNLHDFMYVNGLQKPLIMLQGDIFETRANHIAFGVHYPNSKGEYNNANGGFAGMVAEYGWPELETIKFKKGIPETKFIKGKYFHALPVHCNEEGGWEEAPILIEEALNLVPASTTDVIACVLIGGGYAGEKYYANINNLQGFMRTYKTIVIYAYEKTHFDFLIQCGIAAEPTLYGIPLTALPKVYKLRDGITNGNILLLQ